MRSRSENKIKLVLIRHGATKSNSQHRYLGKTDEALSTEGAEELKRIKYADGYPDIDYLFSSPLKRCLETAGIIYPDKKVNIVPELEEMDFGYFEGKNYIDLQGDERYRKWIDSNCTLPCPEGESREEFIERCKKGFNGILEKLEDLYSVMCSEHKDGVITVGLIAHGGTIMSLMSSFCGGEYFDYQVANGKGYICKLECSHKKIHLELLEKI